MIIFAAHSAKCQLWKYISIIKNIVLMIVLRDNDLEIWYLVELNQI